MDQTAAAPAITPKKGWSWGAFSFNAAFLIGVRKYKYLWWFLFAFVPLVSIIFWIVFLIYLGIKGHVIAASGTAFANQSEHDGYMNAQDHAGKVMFFALLIIIVVVAILGIIFASVGYHNYSPVPQLPVGNSYQ